MGHFPNATGGCHGPYFPPWLPCCPQPTMVLQGGIRTGAGEKCAHAITRNALQVTQAFFAAVPIHGLSWAHLAADTHWVTTLRLRLDKATGAGHRPP